MALLSVVDFPSLGSYVLHVVSSSAEVEKVTRLFWQFKEQKVQKLLLNVGSKSNKSSEKQILK